MILTTNYEVISEDDPEVFAQLCNIIFKKGLNSLQYISPIILFELLKMTYIKKLGLEHYTDKILRIFKKQDEVARSSKREVY